MNELSQSAKKACRLFFLCAATAGTLSAQSFTTLHSFDGTDGASLSAGLVQATDGNLYGTTGTGGHLDLCLGLGCGTVFKISPSGTLTTLHSFDSMEGDVLFAGLVQAIDGNFYGTAAGGGANFQGTVFKITPGGTLTTLYSFCSQSGCTDGNSPTAAPVHGTDGNFYGTTYFGGASDSCPSGCGTVFKVTPSGTLTTLYSFCSQSGCADGSHPEGVLVQDTNGKLYGTTLLGGASGACFDGCGTIFGLSIGLGPFVETEPTSGKVGAAVKVLGTNLTGATGVTFNGTPAAFKVVSPSLISATVPEDATTGKVMVTISSQTLSSNVPFRVIP